MFKRGRKTDRLQTIEAVSGVLKGYGGNAVVIAQGDVVLALRLESGANRQEGQYGPEDGLGVALGDVIRHLTGTPALETGDDGEPDEVRYVPADDPAYVPPVGYHQNARRDAQYDLLAVIRDQVKTWKADGGSTPVVSYAGLEGFLGVLERRMAASGPVIPPPF